MIEAGVKAEEKWGGNEYIGGEGAKRDKDSEGDGGRFSRRGNSHDRDSGMKNKEQEQRTIRAPLVTVHVIQETRVQSIYQVHPFK